MKQKKSPKLGQKIHFNFTIDLDRSLADPINEGLEENELTGLTEAIMKKMMLSMCVYFLLIHILYMLLRIQMIPSLREMQKIKRRKVYINP